MRHTKAIVIDSTMNATTQTDAMIANANIRRSNLAPVAGKYLPFDPNSRISSLRGAWAI